MYRVAERECVRLGKPAVTDLCVWRWHHHALLISRIQTGGITWRAEEGSGREAKGVGGRQCNDEGGEMTRDKREVEEKRGTIPQVFESQSIIKISKWVVALLLSGAMSEIMAFYQ